MKWEFEAVDAKDSNRCDTRELSSSKCNESFQTSMCTCPGVASVLEKQRDVLDPSFLKMEISSENSKDTPDPPDPVKISSTSLNTQNAKGVESGYIENDWGNFERSWCRIETSCESNQSTFDPSFLRIEAPSGNVKFMINPFSPRIRACPLSSSNGKDMRVKWRSKRNQNFVFGSEFKMVLVPIAQCFPSE